LCKIDLSRARGTSSSSSKCTNTSLCEIPQEREIEREKNSKTQISFKT
jgi:hypothetical protein